MDRCEIAHQCKKLNKGIDLVSNWIFLVQMFGLDKLSTHSAKPRVNSDHSLPKIKVCLASIEIYESFDFDSVNSWNSMFQPIS